MDSKISTAKMITRFASLYNASALVFFLLPGGLALLGVPEPYSSFWRVLPALLASFAAITLWLSSNNIIVFSAFPVWNGIIRITFAIVALAADYQSSVGKFILLLALGDLFIGLATILLVKRVSGKSLVNIILNK